MICCGHSIMTSCERCGESICPRCTNGVCSAHQPQTYRSAPCAICTLTKLCTRCRQCGCWVCQDHRNSDGLCDGCQRVEKQVREERENE